ncbi:hypothetical protein K2224_14750 [Streptomyces sp. BHT-5-2]|uniref:hypothetical protein n=1 Tax=Streptomyces sp. BHT-5-2 TaxID=2866715 RepID=UPI001C8D657D|nr:hypothetical protein [Streptomyces sp. BHT-5-2]QZL04282.1 hypothetical protein K2224_14750 [Streptomyces sp. BHT-5-2]
MRHRPTVTLSAGLGAVLVFRRLLCARFAGRVLSHASVEMHVVPAVCVQQCVAVDASLHESHLD